MKLSEIKLSIPNTTVIYCPFCGSMKVQHKVTAVTAGHYRHEEYTVRCMKCGATGVLHERWDMKAQ